MVEDSVFALGWRPIGSSRRRWQLQHCDDVAEAARLATGLARFDGAAGGGSTTWRPCRREAARWRSRAGRWSPRAWSARRFDEPLSRCCRGWRPVTLGRSRPTRSMPTSPRRMSVSPGRCPERAQVAERGPVASGNPPAGRQCPTHSMPQAHDPCSQHSDPIPLHNRMKQRPEPLQTRPFSLGSGQNRRNGPRSGSQVVADPTQIPHESLSLVLHNQHQIDVAPS